MWNKSHSEKYSPTKIIKTIEELDTFFKDRSKGESYKEAKVLVEQGKVIQYFYIASDDGNALYPYIEDNDLGFIEKRVPKDVTVINIG